MERIFLFIIAFVFLNCGKNGNNNGHVQQNRYEQKIFKNITVSANIKYGENQNLQGQRQELIMDIYEPEGDRLSQRPLVILAHGGSFLGGNKNASDIVAICRDLAQRGYVAASVNYRIGVSPRNETGVLNAAWRATQDLRAAVRFFRMNAQFGNRFRINPDKIYAGGSSAGAFMGLHLAYLNEPGKLPSKIDTLQFGGIEGESGNPGFSSKIAAVINLSGAIGDVGWISGEKVPVVSVHGTNDRVVPYGRDLLYLQGEIPVMEVDGSAVIHQRLEKLQIKNQLKTFAAAGHTPYAIPSEAGAAYMDTTLKVIVAFLAGLN
jgi:dienelactone hydrolase